MSRLWTGTAFLLRIRNAVIKDEQKGETEYGITTGCEYPFKLCESEAA